MPYFVAVRVEFGEEKEGLVVSLMVSSFVSNANRKLTICVLEDLVACPYIVVIYISLCRQFEYCGSS